MRSLFGWTYPPGAEHDPGAPWNQEDSPCAVCGQYEDQCVCPECPHCGAFGDPCCYREDAASPPLDLWRNPPAGGVPESPCGLTRSLAQVVLWAAYQDHLRIESERDEDAERVL